MPAYSEFAGEEVPDGEGTQVAKFAMVGAGVDVGPGGRAFDTSRVTKRVDVEWIPWAPFKVSYHGGLIYDSRKQE